MPRTRRFRLPLADVRTSPVARSAPPPRARARSAASRSASPAAGRARTTPGPWPSAERAGVAAAPAVGRRGSRAGSPARPPPRRPPATRSARRAHRPARCPAPRRAPAQLLIGEGELALDLFEQGEDDVAVGVVEQVDEREEGEGVGRVCPGAASPVVRLPLGAPRADARQWPPPRARRGPPSPPGTPR